MRNWSNPTPDELRAWAATPNAVEPEQDWDLALSWLPNEELYLELASDYGAPGQPYFLSLLYLIVGDAVRTGFRTRRAADVQAMLERSRRFKHPEVKVWRRRSRELLASPETFDYSAWCGGGLAREADD